MLLQRVLLVVCLGLAVPTFVSAAETSKAQQQIQQVSLDIQGMNCALCPITIRKKLEKTPGVIEAKVDFDKKMAWVKYDASKVKSQDLIDAVTSIGYKTSLHTANQ